MPTTAIAVDQVAEAASGAAHWFKERTPDERSELLEAIAGALDAVQVDAVRIAEEETHLGVERLRGELARTTFQLRFFGQVLTAGWVAPLVIDHADSQWPVAPRPDLRRVLVPIGPVVVFAGGNFPFAFSVAGGDVASALAAGCPVIVKAHPGHLRLSRLVADTVAAALQRRGAPSGTFQLVVGDEAGRAILSHPCVRAAAFTGSVRVGRMLFDLANRRPVPIPFYGELGSLNPVFITERAASERLDAILDGFLQSFTLGNGQFCTKPGLLVAPEACSAADLLAERLASNGPQRMLSDAIASAHAARCGELVASDGVRVVKQGQVTEDGVTSTIVEASMAVMRSEFANLTAESFGPAAVVAVCSSHNEMLELAGLLDGQLTGAVFGDEDDPAAADLVKVLVERVGRIVWNGWPTGVAVSWAMHHGGPYPATTSPLTSSVGASALARFLRPVVFQGFPDRMLPDAARDENLAESAIVRDGAWQPARLAADHR